MLARIDAEIKQMPYMDFVNWLQDAHQRCVIYLYYQSRKWEAGKGYTTGGMVRDVPKLIEEYLSDKED